MPIELFIYLANVVNNLGFLCSILGASCVAGTFVVLMVNEEWKSVNTGLAVSAVALFFTATLIPSERTMYLMAGASLAKTAVQSDTAKKVQALVDAKLDDMLDHLTKKGK